MNMKKKYILLIVVGIILVVLISSFFMTRKSVDEKRELSDVLNVYNWEDYFAPDTISDFEKEFGVKVNLETYEDEDIMLAAVQSNPSKYDVIIPSDTLVRTMIEMRLLEPLDLENIPNIKNIDQRFRNLSYDPENKYSVPYMWGTTGIGVNTKYIEEDVDSWNILWNENYSGKIAMLNSMRDVIGTSLKSLGYSYSSKDPSELEEARQRLFEQKPLIIGYLDPMSIVDSLVSEDILIAQGYSGDIFVAMGNNSDIIYVIPKEGTVIWVDNLVIPIGAKHKYTAEVFINYILRPDVNAKIANYTWYATANKAAESFIDPEILTNPSTYPSEEIREKLENYQDLGDATSIYNKIWAELHTT